MSTLSWQPAHQRFAVLGAEDEDVEPGILGWLCIAHCPSGEGPQGQTSPAAAAAFWPRIWQIAAGVTIRPAKTFATRAITSGNR